MIAQIPDDVFYFENGIDLVERKIVEVKNIERQTLERIFNVDFLVLAVPICIRARNEARQDFWKVGRGEARRGRS